MLFAVQPAPGAGGTAGGGPLDFLRTNPQFIALRQIVQSNPMILQPMLQASRTFALLHGGCLCHGPHSIGFRLAMRSSDLQRAISHSVNDGTVVSEHTVRDHDEDQSCENVV